MLEQLVGFGRKKNLHQNVGKGCVERFVRGGQSTSLYFLLRTTGILLSFSSFEVQSSGLKMNVRLSETRPVNMRELK